MNNRGGIMKRNLWITIIPAILILLIAVGCNNLGKKPIPEKIGSSQNAKKASFRSNKNVKSETTKVIVDHYEGVDFILPDDGPGTGGVGLKFSF